MSIRDWIVADAAKYVGDTAGFGGDAVFTTPDGLTTKTIGGIGIKHSTALNTDGNTVIGKSARMTISENTLVATGYPVRSTDNTIALKNHRVAWTDSAGINYNYIIRDIISDRSVGLIVLILGDFRGAVDPKKIVGWKPARIFANLVDSPDPTKTQTLDNGDIIPLEYRTNNDNTLTIPYCIGLSVLAPFMVDGGNPVQDEKFNKATGTFDHSKYGGLFAGSEVAFNAAIPIYAQ